MGRCIAPWQKQHEGETLDLPCGKCYECRQNRVNGWSFRLSKELEQSTTAFFITLTYEIPPMTKNGFMTIDKTHVQKFFKRLRKKHDETKGKIKYYAVGEYGSETNRPHYHIILFNSDIDSISNAWKLGHVHSGEVNESSVRYTLKYVCKPTKIPMHQRDDRKKEFSLMSKRMGSNYMTETMIKWHRKDLLNRMYVPLKGGYKIAMPRYYKDKIYDEYERNIIGEWISEQEYEKNSLLSYDEWEKKKIETEKTHRSKQKRANKKGHRLTKI